AGTGRTDVERLPFLPGDRVVPGQIVRVGAETAGHHDHGTGGQRLAPGPDAGHATVLADQLVHPVAEDEFHPGLPAARHERVHDCLAAAVDAVATRPAVVTAEDEPLVERHPALFQPVDRLAATRGPASDRPRRDVPDVDGQVVGEQIVLGLLDARRALQPAPAAHDHSAGQPGGSAEYTFGLHDEHVPAAVLRGGQRGSQAAEAGTDDDDGEV